MLSKFLLIRKNSSFILSKRLVKARLIYIQYNFFLELEMTVPQRRTLNLITWGWNRITSFSSILGEKTLSGLTLDEKEGWQVLGEHGAQGFKRPGESR